MRNLCDEIDRLRAELTKAWEAEQIATNFTNWPTPRSIKDDPPPLGDYVLIAAPGANKWMAEYFNSLEEMSQEPYAHYKWLPMPPPPPKPDPFEEWRATMDVSSDGVIKLVYQYPIVGITHYHYIPAQAAKAIWDAAMKVKSEQKI